MKIFTPYPTSIAKNLLKRFTNVCFVAVLFCLGMNSAKAQYTTATVNGTIGASEYGTHTDGNNQNTNSGVVTYMTWDATNLYVGVSGATVGEALVLYLDKDPQIPVNGGANSNGTNVGVNYDGENFSALQFRADLVIYAKNGYREYKTADGANGWSASVANSGTTYSDNSTFTSGGVQEIAIPWSIVGGIPASFNFFSLKTSSGGFVYGQQPTANAGGSIGTSALYERYYTVTSTTSGSATKPFSRDSYVFNRASNATGFGAISVYDFTMNSTGLSITRATGAGGAWTVSGNLVANAGTVDFGSTSSGATVNNVNISGGTLTLSTASGGDMTVSGNFAKSAGTFTHNSRLVTFNGTAAQAITGTATTFGFLTNSNSAANVTSSVALTVANNLTINGSATLTRLDMGTNTLTLTGATSTITSGFLRSGGTITGGTNTFGSSGTYEHNFTTTLGTIPTATWSTGSTCSIIGYTNVVTGQSAPGGLNQAFSNFTYNCPSQVTAAIDLRCDVNASFSIAGTFNLVSTGTSFLSLAYNSSAFTASIANFNITGGTLYFIYGVTTSATYRGTYNSSGTYTQSGGTVFLANGTTAGRLITTQFNITGNFSQTGGTFNMTNVPPAASAPLNVAMTLSGASSTMTIATGSTFYFCANSAQPAGAVPVVSLTGTSSAFSQTGGAIDFDPSTSTGTGILNLAGTYSRSGTSSMTTSGVSAANGTINFNGGATQTITNSSSGTLSYVDWNVASGSTTTLSTAHAINSAGSSTFTVANGGSLNFSTFVLSGAATSTFVASTGATLATANAAGINSSGASGSVQTTTRTFTNAGVNYTFNSGATNTGTAIGSGINTNIKNLTINNAGGVTVNSATGIVMSSTGTLTFTSGVLDLAALDLTLTSGATVSGAGSGKYVKTSSTGQLKRTALTTAFTFTVGNSAYNPIILTNSGTSDTYGIIAKDGTVPNALDATKAVNRYWAVTEGTGGGGNLAVTAQFNTADGAGGSYSTATNPQYIGLYPNASPWTQQSSGAAASGSNPYTVAASGFTTSLPTSGSTYYFAVGVLGAFANPAVTYTWTGTTSSVWGTSTNWSPNGIPTATDNVIIVTGTTPLSITAAQTVVDATFNGNFAATATGSLTVSGNVTYTSGTGTWDPASTFTITSTSSQNIPPYNYGNLTTSLGNRVWTSGTTGIAGTFTAGAGTYTATSGSTVDYNGSGAQTIAAVAYYNLTNSTNTNRTLANGTITIANSYTPTTGTVTIGTSTVDFSSAGVQTMPATFYYNVTNTGNGNRTWASSGTIDINNGFTPTTATNTITGSTLQYSSTAATTFTMGSFTTNVASRQYNNLILVGGASTIWNLGVGFNMGINGNFSLTGSGTFNVCPNASANTMTVDGNLTHSGTGFLTVSASTGVGALTVTGNMNLSGTAGTLRVTNIGTAPNTTVSIGGDLSISNTGRIQMEATSTASTASVINVAGNFISTATGTSSSGPVDWGAGTANSTLSGNNIAITGNFTKSGTGTFWTTGGTTGTPPTNFGFIFNKTGTQTFSYTGATSDYTCYTINSTSTLQLTADFAMGILTSAPQTTFIVNGVYDMQTFKMTGMSASANAVFTLASGATLISANTLGINDGSASSSLGGLNATATKTYNAAANYTFNAAAAQNTNFPSTTTTMNNLTINNSSNVTLNKVETVNGALTFTNGLIDIGAFNLTLGSSATISGVGTGKYVKTSSTGVLSRTLATATAIAFPVGNSAYNPVTIAQSGSSDVYGLRVVDGSISALSPNDVTLTIDRRWAVTRTSATNVNLTVSPIAYNTGEENNATNFNAGVQAVVGLHNGTSWSQANATQASQTFTTSNTLPTSTVTALSLAMGKDQAFNSTPTITAVGGISASPNNGTATNGYVGSTVTITGTGLTGVTVVKYGGSGGTSVGSFTVVSSTSITFTVASTAVVGQIYVQNGGGNATSAESLANVGYITTVDNNVVTATATWLGGALPPSGANVTIANVNVQVFTGTFSPATVTINASKELRCFGGNLTATDIINNGAFNINSATGTITTTTLTTNSGGSVGFGAVNTLNIAAGGTFTNNNGATFTGGAGTLSIGAGGTITHNTGATFTGGTGTVNFVGAGTINGTSTFTLKNLTINTGGLTLTTVPTIDGIFTINGGNVNQSPIYSSNSTLNYNVSYGRYLEWGATGAGTIGTTAGYPNNVTISTGTFDVSANSGTYGAAALNGVLTVATGTNFNFNTFSNNFTTGGNVSVTGTLNGNTSGGSAISIGGNLTVNSGGLVSLGASTQPMTVTGNVTNASGGSLTLSSASGGDLKLAGNWSNSGTFTPNTRQVTFNSSTAAQTLTGATTFDYLKLNNTFTTATVTLANAITVNNQLDLTAGKLVLAANNCTIGSSGSIVNYTSTNYVKANSTGRLIQTVGASTVFYPVGNSAYDPISLDNTGGTSDIFGVYVVDATTSPAANDNTKLVNRYWNVNEGTASGSNLTVVTQWNTATEENANFAAGTNPKIGLYSGAGPWTTQAATAAAGTVAGSAKYTSNATFVSDISAGGTFGAGKDNGFLGVAPTISSFTPTTQYRGGTIVISGSGFTGTTVVTIGGTNTAFVVNNDNQITATIGAGTSGSVYVQNPSGNYSMAGFIFAGYITTTGASDWTVPASWLGGVVPPLSAATTINDNIAVSSTITSPATVIVNNGATLTFNGSANITATTSLTINSGGTATFTAAVNCTTPLLINNGILSWSAAGTLNISAGGTLTNNSTFTRGSGLVNFEGAGTVDGSSAITFNNATINTGGLTLTTVPTIDGRFQINGGNVNQAPKYSSNSTLYYNASYGRYLEWSATGVGTIGTTPGYPNNVTINTGTFDGAANVGTYGALAMNGLLTINNGGTFNLNAINAAFTVGNGMTVNSGGTFSQGSTNAAVGITGAVSVTGTGIFTQSTSTGGTTITGTLTNSGGTITMGSATGNLTVTGAVANTTGTLTLSSSGSNGDLYVGGNLSNGGTFTHNTRAVFMNGTSGQTISGTFNSNSATNGFPYLTINNSSDVSLGANIEVINTLTLTSGKLILNGFNLVIASGTISNAGATRYVKTNSTGQFKQTVTSANKFYAVGNSAYNPLTLNNTGGTSDTYGVNVIDGNLSSTALDYTYTVDRKWQITEAVSGGSNLAVTAQYNTGEENTNYNSGTIDYLGFYSGSAWTQQAATRAGSNPFTVASNANFAPSNLTTGTQYFAIGRDGAFLNLPPTISSFAATSGYTGSSIVITGNNFSTATAVTFGGTAAASFTINSNTQITAVVGAGASGSVVVTSPSGSGSLAGFSYLGYITQTGATDWATASSWLGGSVPPTGATTTIAHNLTIITAIATPPATIAVNTGISLDVSNFAGSITASTSITNNGTVTFSASGSITTALFTNNSGGTLSWSAAGTLNISAGGTLTNDGTFTRGTGSVTTAGVATINGANAITFNKLNITTGVVTLTTIPTIDGTLKISGGNISAAPYYTSNSTLQYAATYTRFVEWSATGVGTLGTTAGYPNNVLVSNSATFTLLNADAGTARAMAGTLTINTGATFTTGAINAVVTVGGSVAATGTLSMSSTNAKLDVAGSVTIGTTLSLSTIAGGDLYVGGNITNSGSFVHNSRAVFFTGTTQLVSGSFSSTGGTTNGFAYVRINNGTNVTLGVSAYVANDITFNSGKITLSTFDLTLASAATITSPTSSNYIVTNSTGQLKQIITTTAKNYPVGNSSYNPISLRNAGTSDTYGIRVVDAAPPASAIAAKTVNRYWAVTEAVAGSSDLTPVVAQYNTGEEGGSYNAGVIPYMGLYNGTAWTVSPTTLAGSNPFTATSTGTNQFPATIPSSSYFAIGKDDAFGTGTNDYFRSITTGNWNSASTWESSPDSTTWYTATTYPATTTNSVSVRNTHNVTTNVLATPSKVYIKAGGTLTLTNANDFGSTSNTAIVVEGASGNPGTLSAPATLTNSLSGLSALSVKVNDQAIFQNSAGIASAILVTNFTVQNGGTYNHNAIGSTAAGVSADFPGSSRTFGATSNTVITKWGDGTLAPGGSLPNTMGNVTINIATTGGSWNQTANITTIQGNLNIQATGGGAAGFRFTGGTSTAISISGNVNISGGILSWTTTGTPTVTITGGLSQTGGTYLADQSTGTSSTVFAAGGTGGDIDISGGTNSFGNTSVATGRLCNILNTSNINVVTGRTFFVSGYTNIAPGAVISGAGSFQLTNASTATLGIGSTAGITAAVGTASGNVQTTTARTFGTAANYVYTGTANQATGTGLPIQVNTLSIANTGTTPTNIVTMTRTGTTTIAAANPSLILNSGLLSVGSSVNIDITSGGGIQAISGDFDNVTTGTITFKGTGTTTGTINFYPSVYQTPPSTLGVTYGTGVTIRTALRLDVNSFVNGTSPTYSTGSNLVYNSGGSYSRNVEWSTLNSGAGYPYNVTVQNGTTLDMSTNGGGTHYVANDLALGVIAQTGNLTLNNSGSTLNVNGNLTIGSNTGTSTLTLSTSSGGDLKVRGNWTRTTNGAFTPNTRAVYFDGTSGNQTITANGGQTFDYVIVDKSSGNVVLANDMTTNQTLTLTNGLISTSTNKVVANSTIARTNGWVAGNLQKPVASAGTYDYEIGGATNYRPVNLVFSAITGTGNLTASVTQADGDHPNISTSGLANNIKRYFTLTPGGSLTGGTFAGTYNFAAADVPGGANTSNFVIRKYSGSAWSATTTGTRTSTSTQASAISLGSTASAYAIGEPGTLVIATHPASVAICQGANTSFTSTATQTPTFATPSVVWEVSTDGGGTWTPISNGGVYSTATTGTLTITGATVGMDGYQYHAIFTDLNASVTSNPATLTVNPNPAITAMTNATCSGVAFSSTPVNVTNGVVPSGTTYSWSAPVVTGSMTGGASGSGASSITGTLTNPTNAAQTATYTVTPLSGSCTGATFTLTVTVNPLAAITNMTNAACSGVGFSSTPVNVTNGVVPGGTTYSWPAPTVTGGLTGGASGSGASSITGTLTNPTNAAQTATYTVTPLSGSCTGATFTLTVTVNPKPAITAMTNATCSGTAFSSTPTDVTDGVVPSGTTYSWSAPTVTGGLTGGATGSGASSITGTLTNPTNTAQTATYTVTPLSGSCTGTTFTLTVTVNPKPAITAMTNTACSGVAFSSTPVNSTNGVVPSGTTYSWSAPVVTGGMTGGASGSGASSITGTLTNPTNTAKTATYTVTPLSGSCTGATFTVTVTVNPSAAITSMTNTACSGAAFSSTPVNVTNGVVPTGTTYSWSAPTVTGGLTGGASGSGASSITGTLTNPTNAAQTATYTVTPLSGSCTGSTFTLTVTVNPKPAITAMTNATCSGTAFSSTPTDVTDGVVPSGTTYSWSAPSVTGGLTGGATGSGASSITGTLTNPTNAAQTATYTVTPLSGSCTGATFTLTVTVNPKPTITAMTNTACSGAGFTSTPVNGTNGIVPGGTTYSWSAPTVTGGLTGGASGSGASSITGTLTNPTNAAQTATYTVTPLSGSCTGATFTVTVTVNPSSAITSMTNTACSGAAFSSTPVNVTNGIVPTGTTYSWSAPTVTGGLTGGASGSGASSITGTLTNPTNAAQTATYTVTPLSGSCTGATFTVTVTVNPKAAITAMTNAACSGVGFTSTPTDGTNGVVPTGTTYSWPAPTVTGGMTGGASGSGASSITGTLTNPTGTSQTATYTVTPLSGSCTGSTFTLTVTVTPSVGTPVFSLGSTSTRCGGAATITYTATATNNTGITYSLDATSLTAGNTINSSTGAVTYTSTYVGASVITASAAGCNGPATNTHTVTVGSNTWTGATSVTWSTGSNWSCGAAPLSGQDVVIPNVTRKPSLAANTTVGSLSIASGAFVTIGANTLTINGAVSGSGTLTGSLTSNLTMNGTGTLNFTSGAPSNIVNDFVVNSTGTVTLSGKVNVAGVLTPAAGTLTLTDTLTLRAGTEGNYANTATYPVTGTVGVVGATISYTGLGKITVERYVPAKRSYRFIASSVNTATSLRANWMEGTYNAGPGYGTNNNPKPGYGTHITGSATPGDNLDWTLTNNPSLFNYDNATQTWNAVYNSNGTLAAGYPYRLFVRGNRSNDLSNNSAAPTATILRETGTIVSGNVTLGSVSSSPATMPLINGTTGAFSYVGNPYASPVSWLRILAASTNISPTYYAYDANVNVKGAYVSYNAITGFNQFGNFTTSKVDSIIQPGAAFMIETTGASPVLSFTEQFKKAEFTAVWRTVSTMPKIALQLISATGNNILDGAVTVFDNQYGATIGSEDSYKFSNLDENLSIVSNGKQLSIEARPQAQANDSVPLNLSKYKQSSYFLKIASENFDPSLTAVIKDKYLNVELPVDLVGSTQMPFSITTDPASSAANRFVIIFKPGSILPVTLTDVKAYQKEQGIQVDWTAHTEINVDHYEVEKSTTAQQFEKAGIVNARQNNSVTEYYGWFDKNVVTGNNFYRIKIVDKSGSFKYTDIVKVRIAKGEGSISIFPNPVKNKLMHIQLENLDKGRYNVVLYNNLGEKLMTKVIDHTGRSAGYIVDAGQLVSKGSYRLVVSNGDFQLTETVVFE